MIYQSGLFKKRDLYFDVYVQTRRSVLMMYDVRSYGNRIFSGVRVRFFCIAGGQEAVSIFPPEGNEISFMGAVRRDGDRILIAGVFGRLELVPIGERGGRR